MQVGYGLGVFVNKPLFNKHFSVEVGANYNTFSETTSINSSENLSSLNGFYFQGTSPKMFNKISNAYKQYLFSAQINWQFSKLKPSLGYFYGMSNYQSNFLSSTNGKFFDTIENYNFKFLNFGYFLALKYLYDNHINFGINYSKSNTATTKFVSEAGVNLTESTHQNLPSTAISVSIYYNFN